MVDATKQRVGIFAEELAEVTDTVAHFRENEIFFDRRASSWHGIELNGQFLPFAVFCDILVDFVWSYSERHKANWVLHPEFGKQAVFRPWRRTFLDKFPNADDPVSFAMDH